MKEKIADYFFMILLEGSRRFGKGFALVLTWPLIFIVKTQLVRRKKDFMLENIRTSIPGKSLEFYENIIEKSLQHSLNIFFTHVADEAKLLAPSPSIIDDVIHSQEKGAVVITTHHGDWEGVFRFFGNLPNCTAGNFYNRPSNKAADRFIRKVRNCEQFARGEKNTQKIIERFQNMEANRKFFVVVAIDLYTKKGLGVDFLNRETLFSENSLRMAAESQVPIIVATSFVQNEQTEIHFSKIEYNPQELKASKEYTRETLQKIMRIHSDAITENPEQWLFWPQDLWKKEKN